MAHSLTKIKGEDSFECQACAVPVTTEETLSNLVELFKELTGIMPICNDSEVVFCQNCHSTLEAFQLFKSLCMHTQEIFAARQMCDETIHIEEFIVGIEVDESVNAVEIATMKQETRCYTCDICQKQCKTKRDLRIHFGNFHAGSTTRQGKDETDYKCKECNTKLSSLRNLKRHQDTHNSEKCFKCTYCNSKFNSKRNQYYHEKYVHKTGRQYICSDCGYVCYNPTLMNQHIQRHHSIMKFRCDQCPKQCKTPGDLRDHKLVHENLLKTVPCPDCGTLFKHMKAMRTHLRSVHTAKRSFICETCSKGFTSRNGLDRHLVTHTGERKYPCSFCTQAFTQLQALKRHLTTHTGVRPFACPHCNHTFAENFYMNKHSKTCSKKPSEMSLSAS